MGYITKEEIEAIRNEYLDIRDMLTDKVKIERHKAPAGADCLLKFHVDAPTYIIKGAGDINPVRTDYIDFYLKINNGFPKVKPEVYYEEGRILASINVYPVSGNQCIDDWHYDEQNAGMNSTLVGAVKKTLMDIIHEPSVSNYKSMANSSLSSWQETLTSNGMLPTCPLSRLIRTGNEMKAARSSSVPPLPAKRPAAAGTNPVARTNPPALPGRR